MEVWFVTPSLDFSTTRPIFMTWLIIGFWKKDKIELIMMGGLLKCILGGYYGREGVAAPLFLQKKKFLVNLKTKTNASKFAMFMEKENPHSFFCFSFRATFIFPLWMPWSMSVFKLTKNLFFLKSVLCSRNK